MAIECHCLPRISELPVDKSWGKVLSSYKPYLPIIYAVRWPSANISNAWQAAIIYILFIDMTVMERGQRWTNTENINWVQNMYSQILLDDSELFYTIQNHMIWVKIWSNITNPIPKWMTLSSRTEQQEGIFFVKITKKIENFLNHLENLQSLISSQALTVPSQSWLCTLIWWKNFKKH